MRGAVNAATSPVGSTGGMHESPTDQSDLGGTCGSAAAAAARGACLGLMPPCFVAVHCGAGYHAPRLEAEYKSVMGAACKAAAQVLAEGGSSMTAAVAATTVLEDSPITNAGLGSNINEEGFVECDASVMAGDGCFGAVGACPGVRNPVKVARRIAEESRREMPLERVRPIFLGGDGARAWAHKRGMQAAASLAEAKQWHVTDGTRRQWQRYMKLIAEAGAGAAAEPAAEARKRQAEAEPDRVRGRARQRASPEEAAPEAPLLVGAMEGADLDRGYTYDTVGCICIDSEGRCAATVSSGGIAVKAPGRIGEAAIHGSGCWASNASTGGSGCAIACSITGVGEAVMQAALARVVCQQLGTASDELPAEGCARAIQQHILQPRWPGPPLPPDCGVAALRAQRSGGELVVDFGAAHSSQSLACAWLGGGAAEPVCRIDRRPGRPPPAQEAEAPRPPLSSFGCRVRWALG